MSFTPIETQEDFDRAIRERIERERAKYSDYDELKAKAAKFDEAEEARKTELEKAQARINRLEAAAKARDEADRARAMREKVSKETGVPAELISGTDEESMTEWARGVAAFAKARVPAAPKLEGSGLFAGKGASAGGTEDEVLREFANALVGGGSRNE